MSTEHTVEVLNSLLRGEMSAADTYRQALDKIEESDVPHASTLQVLEAEHRHAVNVLRAHILNAGGQPSDDSGLWGTFASAVEGSAKLLGNKTAIRALKEGEEHGVNDYESALEDPDLPPECRQLISGELLPQTRAHIPVLEQMIG